MNSSHVENTGDAQRSRVPALLVLFKRRVKGVGELANDRNGPCRSGQASLLLPVVDLLEDEHRSEDGQDGEQSRACRRILERRKRKVREVR